MQKTVEKRRGTAATCPRCGQIGSLEVATFKAGGREYRYWVVRHGTKRCILERYEEGKPIRLPTPPGAPLPLPSQPEGEPLEKKEERREKEVLEKKERREERGVERREEGREREEREERREEAEPQPAPAPPSAESYPKELQRRAWYAAKVASSVGALKENPTRENLERLKSTAAQITERLGVPTADLLEAAERFLETKSETAKIRLNECLTLVVCRIFSSLPLGDRRGKAKEVLAPLVTSINALEQRVAALEGKLEPLFSSNDRVEALRQRVEGLEGKLSAVTPLAEAVAALDRKVDGLAEKLSSLSESQRGESLSVEQLATAVAEEVAKRVSNLAVSPSSRPREERKRREERGERAERTIRELVLAILSDGRARTRVEIEREIEGRFGVRLSAGSLSGRLSELSREGLVAKEKRGKVWYWRLSGGGEGQ